MRQVLVRLALGVLPAFYIEYALVARLELVQPLCHITSTSFSTANCLRQVETFLRKGEFSSTSSGNTMFLSNGIQGHWENPLVGEKVQRRIYLNIHG